MKDSEIMQCVQVKVEIGHRASPKAKPTKEGFTHDWTVYVRTPEGSSLAHFVEKVEFHLHDTFANPLRVVKEPPYHVSEVGYADFGLPIEIYFKNKGEPQKIKFNYNLFLQTHEPVNYVRCEKLTFVNPTDEFKRKLIKAGGVHVLPPGKAQFADLCGPPIKTESLKKQKPPATISSKVHVLPPGKAQFADLCGPPIKTESLKKQKQHATISSKVLVLPPGEAQFADLFGSPIKFEKQKKPSTISSKEKVSKQILNFSGDEKFSSSGQHINASLKSMAKEVKIDNKSKGHDTASTSSSSSSSSISKEKVQKTKSSREKHSSKESNNTSKMLPNLSPLPSQKRPSDSPIPSENNQTKAGLSSSASLEKFRNEDKQRSEGKAIKDQVVKHNSSQNKDISESKSKDGKHSHKTDTRKQTSSKSSKELKKEIKLKDDKVSNFDDKKEAKDDKEENNDDKKELQDDKKELKKDVKDDRKEVKDHSKVKNEKQEVKDGKREVENHKKEVKDDRKGVKEVKYNNKEDILMDNKSIKEVKDDKMEVKAKKSSGSSESRSQDNKHKVMIKLNTDEEEKSSKCEHSSSKSSSKEENDKEKSSNTNMKSEITTDAKKSQSKQRKRSGSLLSALDGSMAKKQRYSVKHLSKVTPIELKEDLSQPIDISSESDDDFFREITGSDSGVDFDISPTCGIIKTINQNYSISSLKKLMDELEDNSADDDDDIIDTVDVFSRPKSSAKTSPLVESVKESESSEDISSESDDDFFREITGSDSGVDFDISPTCGIIKTINQNYSISSLKKLMDELEDNSADDDDDIIDTVDVFLQPKSSAKTSPLVESVKEGESSEDISSESDDDFFREITGSDSGVDFDISPTCGIIKTINQNYSISSLKKLMDELEDNSADDDDDIINTVDVFSRPKSSAKTSPLVESVKEGESSKDISSESDDDFFREITGSDSGVDFDISPTCGIIKTINQNYSISSLKKLMDELEDNSADDDDDIIDTVDVFLQPKSSAKTSPLVESVKEGESSKDISSESDDDFFLEITGSDSGADLDISPTCGISKTSNQIYSRNALKQLMDELEDNSADDDDDITYDVDIFLQPKSSKVTLMELKDDLYLSSDSSSESDDDFFGEISGSESDMDLALSVTSNISNTSNQIYSESALKNLMDELEDSSADDEDDRKSEITTDEKKSESEKRKRSGSPVSTLFGSMAKRQRVIV